MLSQYQSAMSQEIQMEEQSNPRNIYKCPYCNKTDNSRPRMKLHKGRCRHRQKSKVRSKLVLKQIRERDEAQKDRIVKQIEEQYFEEIQGKDIRRGMDISDNYTIVKERVCPYCLKKENILKIKGHMDECAVVYKQQCIKKQERLLIADVENPIILCRYCDRQFQGAGRYKLHIDKCPKKEQIEMERLTKEGKRIEGMECLKGWVVCPCCALNIRTSKQLFQHIYNECVRNPRNPQKFIGFLENQLANKKQDRSEEAASEEESSRKTKKIKKSRKENYVSKVRKLRKWDISQQQGQNVSELESHYKIQEQPLEHSRSNKNEINSMKLQLNRLQAIICNLEKQIKMVRLEEKLVISQKLMEDNKDKFYELVRQRILKGLNRSQIISLGEEDLRRISLRAIKSIDFNAIIKQNCGSDRKTPINLPQVKLEPIKEQNEYEDRELKNRRA